MAISYRPDGSSSVSPYLMVHDAKRLIRFLDEVFDGTPTRRSDRDDGSILHAEVDIEGSTIMITEVGADDTLSEAWLHIYVPDAAQAYARALKAGATSLQEPKMDEEAGDLRAGVKGACGNRWFMATRQQPSSK